jgi:hypothetical protein
MAPRTTSGWCLRRAAARYFFLRACVNALPAADFEAFAVRPSRSTCDAWVAAAADVCFFGAFACARALPAADLELLPVDLLASVFDARLAAAFDVTTVLAMENVPCAEGAAQ